MKTRDLVVTGDVVRFVYNGKVREGVVVENANHVGKREELFTVKMGKVYKSFDVNKIKGFENLTVNEEE